MTIGIENVGAVKSSNVEFNTRLFDNPNITSAGANSWQQLQINSPAILSQ
jgi:hypothetical protein